MQKVARIFLSFILCLSNLHLANAAGPNKPAPVLKGQQLEVFLTMFTQTTSSTQGIETLFNFSEIAADDKAAMLATLNKNVKEGDLFQMKLADDQLFVDGKPTGIRILSYEPLKVEFKSKTWTFNSKESAKNNYASLMKILVNEDVASVMDLFIPKAHAEERHTRAAAFGFGALVVIGGILYVAAGAITIPVTVLALAAGAGGATIGWNSGKKEDIRNQQRWADELLRSPNLQVDCHNDRVALSGTTSRGQSLAVRFERVPRGRPGLVGQAGDYVWTRAFGPQPNRGPIENRQYISGNFGGRNVAERDVQTPLQRNSSFVPALEFNSAQAAALSRIMNCRNMDEWVADCFKQKLRKCTGITPGEEIDFAELMRRANEQKACINANAEVIGQGRCMLPLEVFRTYAARTQAPRPARAAPGAK